MMRLLILVLLVLALIVPGQAINTTFSYYCPPVMFVNDTFTIWGDYELEVNGTDILDAYVVLNSTLSNTSLTYTNGTSRYQEDFQVVSTSTWEYSLTAGKTGYDNVTVNCTTRIVEPFVITVNLWEEVELQTVLNTSQYALTTKNYNKQLIDPYVNEFAWIVARNNDLNFTGAYNYCNFPFSAGSQAWDSIIIPNYMGNDPDSDSLADLKVSAGQYIGCNNAWYRGEYISGSADINVSLPGNYSLYLVEGTIEWESNLSPPKLIKSNLFIFLGDIVRPDTSAVTYDFYVSHDELDFWASMSDNIFLFLVTIVPLLLFIFLILVGVPIGTAGLLAISWTTIWTLINLVV